MYRKENNFIIQTITTNENLETAMSHSHGKKL